MSGDFASILIEHLRIVSALLVKKLISKFLEATGRCSRLCVKVSSFQRYHSLSSAGEGHHNEEQLNFPDVPAEATRSIPLQMPRVSHKSNRFAGAC
jgi:hypothetical protein